MYTIISDMLSAWAGVLIVIVAAILVGLAAIVWILFFRRNARRRRRRRHHRGGGHQPDPALAQNDGLSAVRENGKPSPKQSRTLMSQP